MAAAQGDPCLISVPSALGFFLGSGCIYSKTNARALIAGGMILAGSIVLLAGITLITVEGFRRTGALSAVRQVPIAGPWIAQASPRPAPKPAPAPAAS